MICDALEINPGHHPTEKLYGSWENATVSIRHRDGTPEARFEIINTNTNERYLQEPQWLISVKCAALALMILPVYSFVYNALHLIRLPIATLLHLSPTILCKEIWTLVRFPLYVVGLELAAIYGIFSPLNGRAMFGRIESALHAGKTRYDAENCCDPNYEKPFLELSWQFLSEKDHAKTFFIAYCMQPIGSTTDPHLLSVEMV